MMLYVPPPKFFIGQRVRVVPNARNRTPRDGIIRDIIWHHEHQRHNYYLQENRKKVSKRYYDDDLQPV